MERIDRHPLWTAFLLPSVVGTAAKLICKDHDPLTLIDQYAFSLDLLYV